MFNLALATSISDFIVLGVGGKMLHYGDADGTHNRLTPDVGLLVKADPVTLGLTAYNLVSIDSPLAPRQYAGAVCVAPGHGLHLEADVVFDTSTHADTTLKYEGGVEWEAIPVLALRGGYVEDRILGQRAITGGVGVMVPPGFGVDVGYRHELLGDKPGRVVMVGINLAI
jgi:hypothetical protein